MYNKGEFIPEFAVVYILNPREANELRERGTFKELGNTYKYPLGQRKTIKAKKAVTKRAKGMNASSTKESNRGGRDTARSGGISVKSGKEDMEGHSVATERRRSPEDTVYEDFEGGQLSSWATLGITVPDTEVDLSYDYLDDPQRDKDLRIAVGGMYNSHEVSEGAIDWNDLKKQDIEEREALLQGGTLARMRHAIFDKDEDTDMYAPSRFWNDCCRGSTHVSEESFRPPVYTERDICWKVCKFAEMMLSDEINKFGRTMVWDTYTFKEFNKVASKLHGIVAQNLAVCFNLNAPEGFTRFSDWTAGEIDDFDDPPERNIMTEQDDNYSYNDNSTLQSTAIKTFVKIGQIVRRQKHEPLPATAFNDRIIKFLAEVLVSSRHELVLTDCQLSGPARVAWRAICRALRRKTCSFVIPSLFVSPKDIYMTHINLQQNQLDCGDAILIAEIIKLQRTLISLDVSHNRIGARGFGEMVKSFRTHINITTFRISHNRIGPAAGKDVGLMLKQSRTLKIVDISHNRLGEMIRYSNALTREHIVSAARDIFMGLRSNRNLHTLDVSYNNLGPKCADLIPLAVMRHAALRSLNVSGNDIGPQAGPRLIWNLAGVIVPKNGPDEALDEEEKKDGEGADGSQSHRSAKSSKSARSVRSGLLARSIRTARTGRTVRSNITGISASNLEGKPASRLAELGLADNQLGMIAGYALGTYLRRTQSLTSLDISRNSIGHKGGRSLLSALCELFGVGEYKGSKKGPTFPQTLLMHLDVSHNGLGPDLISSLGLVLSSPSCTLTSLDISGNPIGQSAAVGPVVSKAMLDMRAGLGANVTLRKLDVSKSSMQPVSLISMLGAVAANKSLVELHLKYILFDEPCCLLLSKAIESSPFLTLVDIPGGNMGPKGGGFVCTAIERTKDRLKYVDLSDNHIGSFFINPITHAISSANCTIHTLLLGGNELGSEGGRKLCSAIVTNTILTTVDLRNNNLTEIVASQIADDYKILVTSGGERSHVLRWISFSDNPLIGRLGAKSLVKSFSSESMEHMELANVGAGPRAAAEIAKSLRNVTVAWKYLDVSNNNLSRQGLNDILWALRRNRRVKVLHLGNNKAGLTFGSDVDVKGDHGVALPRAIQENLTVRQLDLSYNGMSSNAAKNVFTALVANMSVQRLSLRGNLIDDEVSIELTSLLRMNDVIQDLDLGDNRLGYQACFAIAEGLLGNRSLKVFHIDKNKLGSAGPATMESFWTAICMNFSLRVLNMDENRLGTEWGIKLADAFARTGSLIYVSLQNNRFDSRAGEALYRTYCHNKHLTELVLTEEEIGADIYRDMRIVFHKKRALESPDSLDSGESLLERQRFLMFGEYA